MHVPNIEHGLSLQKECLLFLECIVRVGALFYREPFCSNSHCTKRSPVVERHPRLLFGNFLSQNSDFPFG